MTQEQNFNLDALSKAYETGILRREDFGTDEDWNLAMDIFNSQTTEETKLEGLDHIPDICEYFEKQEALQMVEDFTNDEPTFGIEDFKSLHPSFDWDNDYTEVGFPDGQFMGNGLGKIESAFLSECWRSELTEHANEFIQGIEDSQLRSTIQSVYSNCNSVSGGGDRLSFDFPWDSDRIEPDNGGDIWGDGTY